MAGRFRAKRFTSGNDSADVIFKMIPRTFSFPASMSNGSLQTCRTKVQLHGSDNLLDCGIPHKASYLMNLEQSSPSSGESDAYFTLFSPCFEML